MMDRGAEMRQKGKLKKNNSEKNMRPMLNLESFSDIKCSKGSKCR